VRERGLSMVGLGFGSGFRLEYTPSTVIFFGGVAALRLQPKLAQMVLMLL